MATFERGSGQGERLLSRGSINELPLFPLSDQWSVFWLTFNAYAALHVGRKAFSLIKSSLIDAQFFQSDVYSKDEQSTMAGLLDTLFLAFYAVGLYLSGMIGDRFHRRRVLFVGMSLTGVLVLLFGVLGFLSVRDFTPYAVLWSLNGLVQSSGWPTLVAVVGSWFGKGARGATIGVWSGNASFGNIVGAGLVAFVLFLTPRRDGWKWAMCAAGVYVMAFAAFLNATLVPHPCDVGLPDPNAFDPQRGLSEGELDQLVSDGLKDPLTTADSEKGKSEDPAVSPSASLYRSPSSRLTDGHDVTAPIALGRAESVRGAQPISFVGALLIPGVVPYALAYAALKGVNYGLFFWLPVLLSRYGMSNITADLYSMLYDVGQIAGGVFAGYLTDVWDVRAPITTAMLLVAATLIFVLRSADLTVMTVMLPLIGFFMGGPANLISALISADLGQHPSLKGNSRAIATVSGIVDGTGSLGAAVAQYLVGFLADCRSKSDDDDDETTCSWGPVFIMLILADVLAAAILGPLTLRELGSMLRR